MPFSRQDIPEPLPAGRFRDNSPLLPGGLKPEGDGNLHIPERLLLGHAEGRAPRKFRDHGDEPLILIAVDDLDCVFILRG